MDSSSCASLSVSSSCSPATEVVNTETATANTFVKIEETETAKVKAKKAEDDEPDVWGLLNSGGGSSSSVAKTQDMSKSNYKSTMGMDPSKLKFVRVMSQATK